MKFAILEATRSPEGRQIYWRTVLILALILLLVVGAGFRLLYREALAANRVQLTEMVNAQARMMESVAKFDAYFQSGEIKGAGRAATLSQFREGHRTFKGFGDSGEIMLGEQVGNEIIFLLPSRKLDFQVPSPVSILAEEGGPMEIALRGESGTIIDIDYTGDKVLAAYEWLPFLEMGLVSKMDMAEFNKPFITIGIFTASMALLAIVIGAALNARTVSPLIEQIIKNSQVIRKREATYRDLVETIPGIVYRSVNDDQLTMLDMSGSAREIVGRPAEDFINNDAAAFGEIVVPEDRDRMQTQEKGEFNLDYRIQRPDGSERWVADHGRVSEDESGVRIRQGVLLDITGRKSAEADLKELHRKLSRYISPQVYNSIFQGKQDAQVGSTRKKLTIFFSDVVNFTMKSESLDPDDLSFIVNSYLNRMAELAFKHGGTLDKFIGDGVVIFFGDPESRGVQEDARACVRMAMEMHQEVAELNEAAFRHGINSPIEIRIGIATGFSTVGNFGSETRMDYTVLGMSVNLAARLESAAPAGGILVSEETALLIDEEFVSSPFEPIRVKGFEQPVQAHLVDGRKSDSA